METNNEDILSQMYARLNVSCLLFIIDCTHIRNLPIYFSNNRRYEISRKSAPWKPDSSVRMNGHDRLIVVFATRTRLQKGGGKRMIQDKKNKIKRSSINFIFIAEWQEHSRLKTFRLIRIQKCSSGYRNFFSLFIQSAIRVQNIL
jgi:hypothetical protein